MRFRRTEPVEGEDRAYEVLDNRSHLRGVVSRLEQGQPGEPRRWTHSLSDGLWDSRSEAAADLFAKRDGKISEQVDRV